MKILLLFGSNTNMLEFPKSINLNDSCSMCLKYFQIKIVCGIKRTYINIININVIVPGQKVQKSFKSTRVRKRLGTMYWLDYWYDMESD